MVLAVAVAGALLVTGVTAVNLAEANLTPLADPRWILPQAVGLVIVVVCFAVAVCAVAGAGDSRHR